MAVPPDKLNYSLALSLYNAIVDSYMATMYDGKNGIFKKRRPPNES